MATVYSVQLAAGVVAAGAVDAIYTVPSGYVVVVRELAWRCQSASAATLALAISGVATPFFQATTTDKSQPPWSARLVLTAGQVLEIEAGSEAFEYVLSGYLLSL